MTYGAFQVSPWTCRQWGVMFSRLRVTLDGTLRDRDGAWAAQVWRAVATCARWRRRAEWRASGLLQGLRARTRRELWEVYRETWESGAARVAGWVPYGTRVVRRRVLTALRSQDERVRGAGAAPPVRQQLIDWVERERALSEDDGVRVREREWMDYGHAIRKGVGRWLRLGGAEALRREGIRRAALDERAERKRRDALVRERRRAVVQGLRQAVRGGQQSSRVLHRRMGCGA